LYNIQGQPQEHERIDSPLKFQSRCIAAFPDTMGYAVGSIEGRVGIHYMTKVHGKESFAVGQNRSSPLSHTADGQLGIARIPARLGKGSGHQQRTRKQ
jgi:hypothetical protein